MWARLSDPGTYQALSAFHHACAVGRRDALETAARAWCRSARGVLILDGTSFPETGHGLGRGRAAVLRRARQDRELPDGGHRRAVDGHAGVAAGRDVVSARGMADAAPARAGPDSRDRAIRAEMATGLDAAAPGARGGVHASPPWSAMPSSATTPRCAARCIAPSCPTRWGSRPISRCSWGRPALEAPPPLTGKGRPRTRRRLPPDTHTVEARVWAATQTPRQWRLVSWRNGTNRRRGAPASVPSASRPPTTGATRRLAPEVWLLCERELAGGDRDRYYLVDLPAHRLAARPRPPRASALGDRAAVPGTQRRNRARSLRRPQPAGVATPRRA